jgi:hypothetical protein
MLVGALPRAWVTPDILAEGHFPDVAAEHRTQLDRLPPGMERALIHALALRPEERFVSPGEFAAALESPETLTVPALPDIERFDASVSPARQAGTVAADEGGGFLGAPATLIAERVVDGEALPEDLDYLLEEVRAAFRVTGHTGGTDRALIWTSRRPKDSKETVADHIFDSDDEVPDVLLRVGVRGGKTHILLEHRLGGAAGGIFGGIMGGGGAGGLGAVFGIGLAALQLPLEVVFAIATGWIGGSYVLSRSIFQAVSRSKRRGLESLADRLAEQLEEGLE